MHRYQYALILSFSSALFIALFVVLGQYNITPVFRHHILRHLSFRLYTERNEYHIPRQKYLDAATMFTNLSRLMGKKVEYKTPFVNASVMGPHKPTGENMSFAYIRNAVNDGLVVPNAAHFVLPFYRPTLEFHHLVCILSAFWVMKPLKVFFWYNEMPSGEYWDYLTRNISDFNERVIMVYRPKPTHVYNVPIRTKEHASDIVRMEALLVFGGAYFDIDVIVLRPLETLRVFQFTIGRETEKGLCNGAMLSEPNSLFGLIWAISYQAFNPGAWNWHSVHMPDNLHRIWPTLAHVEERSMDRPNWHGDEVQWIYGKKRLWDWSKNYVMHLWYRSHGRQYNFQTIKIVDSMLGDMFRMILFGNTSLGV